MVAPSKLWRHLRSRPSMVASRSLIGRLPKKPRTARQGGPSRYACGYALDDRFHETDQLSFAGLGCKTLQFLSVPYDSNFGSAGLAATLQNGSNLIVFLAFVHPTADAS